MRMSTARTTDGNTLNMPIFYVEHIQHFSIRIPGKFTRKMLKVFNIAFLTFLVGPPTRLNNAP